MSESGLFFFKPNDQKRKMLHLAQEGVSAGFPLQQTILRSSALVLIKKWLKMKRQLSMREFSGQSIQGAGLDDGDLLVIDRSQEPENNAIAVCFIDGEFTVKRLKVEKDCVYLMPENPKYHPIKVTADNQLQIWGVVTYVVKKV